MKDQDMLCKGCVFAAMAAFGACASLTGAHAQPGFIGLALQDDHTAIAKVDYYYSGDYGYRENYYNRDTPLDIPFRVLGGVAGLVGGVLDGVFDDGTYYSRPCYVSPYYGSPYYHASYNGGSYYDSSYSRNGYYFDSRYGDRRSHSYSSRHDYELDVGYDYTYYYSSR